MRKKRCHKWADVLFGIIFSLVMIIYFSVRYYMQCWNVEFSIALYQMASPLKGTNPDYVFDYINIAAVPCGIFLLAWFFGWKLLHKFLSHISLMWKVKTIGKSFCLKVRQKVAFTAERIVRWTILVVAACYVTVSSEKVGVFEYIKESSNATKLYEENYVSPDAVEISFPEHKRNLILIYLESMETTYMDQAVGGGKKENYIPELTDLAQTNIMFSNSDRLGGGQASHMAGWTMAAILATSAGVPYKLPFEGNAAGNYSNFLPGLIGLGEILDSNGYQNYFLCGSEAEFGGRELFYQTHGNYQIYDYAYAVEAGRENEEDKTNWGYNDKKLFEYAKEYLTVIGQNEAPFNFTILTVDTHHPAGYLCELCEMRYPEQYANVLACSSRQTAEFVKWIQNQEWYEETAVVMLGDHLSMATDFWDDIGDYERYTYNCFINADKDSDVWELYHNRQFTSYDYFPTILSAMSVEIEGDRLGLGTDLFSGEKTLVEKIGMAELEQEIERYSDYYMDVFVNGRTYD